MNTPSRRKWVNHLLTIVVLCILLTSTQKVSATVTITWDGEGGDGLWSNPLNWSGDIVPVSASEIVIDGDVGEIHLDTDFTVGPGTLTLGSFFSSQNDTLIIDSGVTLTINGDQNTVTVLRTGTLLNNGIIQIEAGELGTSSGTVTNNVGGVINGGQIETTNDDATINNNGTIGGTVYRPGRGVFNNNGLYDNAFISTHDAVPSTINNNVGGTINVGAGKSILIRYSGDVFNNYGTLNNIGTTVETVGTFNNMGTLDNTGGTFTVVCEVYGSTFYKVGMFLGSGTVLGNSVIEQCKVWDGDAGNGLWSDALNWSNNGLPDSTDKILIDGTSADTVVHLDTTFTIGGILVVKGSSSLDNFDNTFFIDSGVTLTNDGTIVNRRQTFTNNGTLVNNGTFSNESHLTINNATFNNNGLLTNIGTFGNGTGISSGTSIVNNNSGAIIDNQNTFENDGMVYNFCGGATINVPDVNDACPPVINMPGDLVVQAESGDSVQVSYTVTAFDDVDGPLLPACLPLSGSPFFVGTTVVECSVSDAAGNLTTASFNITVEPPVYSDLIIESFTHLPVSPTSEDVDPMTFTAVVKNIGDSDAGPSTLNIRIGGETFGQDFAIPALAPGSSHTIVRNEYLTLPRGYINHATADVHNEVTETDETNNAAEDIFVVWDATPPTLSVDTVSAPQDGFLPASTIIPSSGQALGASPIQLSGTVDDNRPIALPINIALEVNGANVPVQISGSWTASLLPTAGGNEVIVTATDIAGNSTETSFIVNYDLDLDDDTIQNSVDVEPYDVSSGFADTALGGATSGWIADQGNQILTVWAHHTEGVNIMADPTGGEIPATVSACSDSARFSLSPGDEVRVVCGSVTLEVISGPVEVNFISSNWTEASATLAAGDSLTFEPVTLSFSAPAWNTSPVVVLIDGYELSIGSGTTILLAVANDDTASTQEDTPVSLDVLDNDSHNVTTEIVSITQGEHGTVTTDGSTVTYSPNPDFCGSDTFEYTLNEGTSSTNTAAVDISIDCVNDAPIVGKITAPSDPIRVNDPVDVSGMFIDVDESDTHTATWIWGDGSSSVGTIDEANGTVTGNHIYSEAGVYTLELWVTDQDGVSDMSIFRYIVIFDPSGGFVTGGGWIDSPEGAYTPDPALTGKATFGFVSKYKKGTDTPTGQTEFQFKVADLNFNSDSYEWLVIAGAKAKYKGIGTINGEGEYKFLLTGVDADVNPNDNIELDRFRIKIWVEDEGGAETVIYDNGLGADDNPEDPTVCTTEIGGGSIVIHKRK